VIPNPWKETPMRAVRPSHTVLDCAKLERNFEISLPGWRHSIAHVVRRPAAR